MERTMMDKLEDTTATPNQREKATWALIESFATRYPQKGFLMDPSLRFSSPGSGHKGIGVTATTAIKKGQNLMVIPKVDMLQSVQGSTPKELLPLQKKLTKKFRLEARKDERLGHSVTLPPTWLAIRIMNLLSTKNLSRSISSNRGDASPLAAMDPFWLQSDTWPSEDELKDSYLGYWDKHKVEEIWGYKSGLTMDWIHRIEKLNQVFENIVYPLLQKEAGGGKDFVDESLPSNTELLKSSESSCSRKELLRNTYWYADGIVFTRSHGTTDAVDENEHTDCQIIPLVDLFNGDVTGATVDTSSSVNVNLVRGNWPFLGGGIFLNECGMTCSCVYALRNIEAGEELVISYGDDLTVNAFMIKYGVVPKSLLEPTKVRCNIRLWCDPAFLPEEPQRIACLRQNGGFPLEDIANDRDCSLTAIMPYFEEKGYPGMVYPGKKTTLDLYNQGIEEVDVMSMRHFLILAVLADEFELHRNLTTGKLRGNLYESRVLPLLCRMIDYNLELLQGPESATTSADDARRAKTLLDSNSSSNSESSAKSSAWEASALLARVAYRETLLAWRHAFFKKAVYLAGLSVENLLYETAHPCCPTRGNGCGICGRSYPSLKCSRCKGVQYCSREHQKLDWKYHKALCGGSSSNQKQNKAACTIAR